MNKFKKIIYDVVRNYILNYLTGNLGKVTIDDDKITCYVKKRKVKKERYDYTIACFGIEENPKDIIEVYELNKPVCYVIDGLEFKNHKVQIFGYNNCEVIIKNCNFEFDLCIHINGKCTLDNTNIKTFSYLSIGANELTIKNMNSDQLEVLSSKSDIGFGAYDRIDVIDSNIGNVKKNIKVSFLATNELNIVNSNICGKDVVCESSKINADENSSLIAIDKVTLKADDFNTININAPTIILNEEEITNERKSVVLKKITDSLALKRLELIKLLRKIKNECESTNTKKVSEYQEELNAESISKVLKK